MTTDARAYIERGVGSLLPLSVGIKSGTAGPSRAGPGLVVTLVWSLFHGIFYTIVLLLPHGDQFCLRAGQMKHEFVRGDNLI